MVAEGVPFLAREQKKPSLIFLAVFSHIAVNFTDGSLISDHDVCVGCDTVAEFSRHLAALLGTELDFARRCRTVRFKWTMT